VENIILIIYIFTLGLLIGSFLNVCIHRIPKGESIVFPPSHCTSCGNRIKPYDLIPVISWLILRGKCRNCGEKVSFRYAFIELLTGLLFVAVYLRYGFTFDTIKFISLIPFLIVIGAIDMDTTDVYSVTTWPGIALGVVFMLIGLYMGIPIKTFILGGVFSGGLISIIILITKGMGWVSLMFFYIPSSINCDFMGE